MNIVELSIDSINDLLSERSSEGDTSFDSFIIDVFDYAREFKPLIMDLCTHFHGEFVCGFDDQIPNVGFAVIWIDGLYFEICCEPRFNMSTLFSFSTFLSIKDIIDFDEVLENEPVGAIEDS
jgi:hypothetical protein